MLLVLLAFFQVAQPAATFPPGDGPVVAATRAELQRLRAAYRGGIPPVVAVVERARAGIRGELRFPPRGGQHNQWYQCPDCQLGLVTRSETEHQCRKCDKLYSGAPYDDVVFSRIHSRNARRMRDAAWAFAVTGERAFLDFAKRVLLGYAERYREYPYHTSRWRTKRPGTSGGHIKEQTLSEASMLVGTFAPAYDLVRAELAPEERQAVRDGLIRPMLVNIDKCKRGKSNWQSWHNAALLWGGAVLRERKWIERAIEDPKHGFRFQMRTSVTADGMWYENSWGYHLYTLRALVALAEGARRIGIDLWREPRLVRMFTLPLGYRMADGTLPRFGDSVTLSLRHQAALFETAYAALRERAFLRVLAATATWESVLHGREPEKAVEPRPIRSQVARGAGHVLLFEGPYSLALTFGEFGGFHGHFDKLSFVLFGYGEELGVDPGRARSQAYRLPIHREWYRATLSHNAVVVGGKSQRAAAGRLLAFVRGEGWSAAAVSCDKAYPGVGHARLVVLAPDGLVVIDELASTTPTTFDWLYHGRARSVRSAMAGEAAKPPALRGARFVEWTGRGQSDASWTALFEAKRSFSLTMAAAPATTVRTGHGPGESVLDRVPLVVASRRGTKTRFAACITCRAEPPVLRTDEGGLRVRFKERELVVSWDGRASIDVRYP